ncbi:MAG: protein kinase [Planctomycetes bacterium]|nr:protein kinase [Planctomycetota bacterium]MBI3844000.1 protein kinase [Planctomycetota bacterium]
MSDPDELYDALPDDFVDAGLRCALTPAPESSVPHGNYARPALEAEPARAPDERYELRGEIGRGGVGIVVRGYDVEFGRDVAMKILLERHRARPKIAERFVEEARIAGKLQHPGIVPVYDFGKLRDGRPFFTMRLVQGRTLAELLAARSSVESDRHRFLGIFEQVCQAVAYAHTRGVVHLDLKPANVMVGSFGEVQVMDWGLSRVLAADEIPAAGSVMGTPGYVSPEAARGEVHVLDARTDVFGLGAILGEILTGKPPVVADSPRETLRRAAADDLSDGLDRLRTCNADSDLVELATRCLAPNPDARPSNAEAVASRISSYLGSVEERAQAARIMAAETRVKAENAVRSRRLVIALASSVLLTMAVGGTAWWWLDREHRTRADSTTSGVNEALADAARFEGEARSSASESSAISAWDHARASADRAASLLRAGESTPGLAKRVEAVAAQITTEQTAAHDRARQAERDQAIVARLESVRVPEGSDLDLADNERLNAEYSSAFREYGIDVDAIPADEAARSIARSRIALTLVGTLDDWAERRLRVASPRWSRDDGLRLLEIAEKADADDRRLAVRESLRTNDVESLRTLAESEDLSSWPKETLLLLARQLYRADMDDQCLTILRLAHLLHPDDFRICFELGNLLDRAGAKYHEDAIRCFAIARALRPKNVEALHRLGRDVSASQQFDTALRLFREATSLRPNDGHLLAHLGALQHSLSGAESALPALREAVKLEPNDAYAWFQYGRCLLGHYELEAAEAADRKAIELQNGEYPDAWFNLGVALNMQSKFDDELAAYLAALEHDPNHDYALEHVAAWHTMREEWSAAMPPMRHLVELQPTVAATQRKWGIILRHNGDVEGALSALNEAVRLDPDDAESHYELAATRYAGGNVDAAIASLRTTVRLRPDHVSAHHELARMSDLRGLEAEFIAEQRAAVRLAPDNDEWRNTLAWALVMTADPHLRDPDGAVELARRSIARNADSAANWNTLGIALYRRGDWNGAADALQHAMSLRGGGDGGDWIFLAMTKEQLGDHGAALDGFLKAVAPGAKHSLTPGEWTRAYEEAAALIERR